MMWVSLRTPSLLSHNSPAYYTPLRIFSWYSHTVILIILASIWTTSPCVSVPETTHAPHRPFQLYQLMLPHGHTDNFSIFLNEKPMHGSLSFCSSLMFPHCETRLLALEWLSPSWRKRGAACRLWWRTAGWQRRPGRRRRPTGSWRPGWRPAGFVPCCSCRTAGRRSNHLPRKSGFRLVFL